MRISGAMYPAVILAALTFTLASEERIASVADCTFIANRDEVLTRETRIRRETGERAEKVSRAFSLRSAAPAPGGAAMPRRNYIDEEIFGKMARLSVTPARLTDDQEFFRRINLDLIGRLPSPGEIRDFLAGASPAKRDEAIDRLLYSPEFVDKWTLWLGDLLQNTSSSVNVARQIGGRDAFYNWIKQAVLNNKSFKDLAYETIIACGNTYDPANGATNFVLGSSAPMGPIQDTYDMMLVKSATTFLGLGYYDCLLCHNGRRHLDLISLWGGQATRAEAWQMAAFFARQRFHRSAAAEGEPLYRSTDVVNAATGAYDLNTNYGNRPARAPIGNIRSLTPQYRLGGTPARGQEWRDAFAANIAADPMFSRNIVNRLWKEFFNLGLVDPVDTLDPARMDPANPPPAPWTLQPTHPELLNRMAQDFVAGNFNLREFIRTLVQSNAYQLSSRYDGEWKYEYTVLFARHYPRRLMGEEIADAIAKATGVSGNYRVTGWAEAVPWAIQLPEPREGNAFMNNFYRGNRDTQQRSQSGSILQQLGLMNDSFVITRIRMSASHTLQAIARLGTNDAVVEEMFLTFLSRRPDDYERSRAAAWLAKANTPAARNTAIEDLAWACINKLDFLFSY